MNTDAVNGPSPAEQIQSAGGKASAEEGKVVLDGPDGVAVTMTRDAAAETGEQLLRAAAQAHMPQATDAQ